MLCTPLAAPADHNLGFDRSSPWYAIYTRHQHEQTVAKILAVKGFETLLPLYESARRWKDRTKILSLPLFPCYVFVKAGPERRLDILTTPGVCSLVSSGGKPSPIPPVEIEVIRRAFESGAPLEPYPLLKCGDAVRIKCGPLAGVEGILVRKKNLYQLVLTVQLLGRAAAVQVDTLQVERLNYERHASSIEDDAGYKPTSLSGIAILN